MSDQYNDIPPEEREKAVKFFKQARSVAATGNYEYAIEMYIQGLTIDPENLEGHMELREVSMKRKAGGGKAMGMMERMKYKTSNRDDKLNMVNAERLLAYDPGNTDYMQTLMQNAHRAGFFDTVMWIGPILQKANADGAKPAFDKFVVLKDVYASLARDVSTPPQIRPELWKRATTACHYAAAMKPQDMDLQTELKNLGAMHTMDEGGYSEGVSFRKSMKDRDTQESLLAQDKGVQELSVMKRLINDAEAQYRADPVEGKAVKLAETMAKTEDPDYENKAIELLGEWHKRTKQFRFRKMVGEIQMRQWNRMDRSQKDYVEQNPDDKQAVTDYNAFKKDKAEFELTEYSLWAQNYPTETTFKFESAKRMFLLHRFEECIPMLQDARNDAKHRTRATILLGRAFFELKFLDEAVSTLDALIKEYQLKGDDHSKEMYYWCARAFEERGDKDQALRLYSQIVQWEFRYRDVQQRIRSLRNPGQGAQEKPPQD